MAGIAISRNGVFEVDGRAYRIPAHFSSGVGLGYRTLLDPTLENPSGKRLTAEQRIVTRTYLLGRAAACAIPGFRQGVPQSLALRELESIHRWIVRHRPELCEEPRGVRSSHTHSA